jgi:hypothetical protein
MTVFRGASFIRRAPTVVPFAVLTFSDLPPSHLLRNLDASVVVKVAMTYCVGDEPWTRTNPSSATGMVLPAALIPRCTSAEQLGSSSFSARIDRISKLAVSVIACSFSVVVATDLYPRAASIHLPFTLNVAKNRERPQTGPEDIPSPDSRLSELPVSDKAQEVVLNG